MVHDEGSKNRTLPMSILAGLLVSQALPLSKLVERTHELIDRWTECSARFGTKWISFPLDHKYTSETLSFDRLVGTDKRLAQAFSAVPSSKLAMYLVQESFTFGRRVVEDEETYECNDSKERLDKVACLHLRLFPQEGEVVSFLSVESALKMHTLLNRVGNGPVLDKSDLDKRIMHEDEESDEGESVRVLYEDPEYDRYLLLLTPKRFESEMLSTMKRYNDI
jgi:hypothetical protein